MKFDIFISVLIIILTFYLVYSSKLRLILEILSITGAEGGVFQF